MLCTLTLFLNLYYILWYKFVFLLIALSKNKIYLTLFYIWICSAFVFSISVNRNLIFHKVSSHIFLHCWLSTFFIYSSWLWIDFRKQILFLCLYCLEQQASPYEEIQRYKYCFLNENYWILWQHLITCLYICILYYWVGWLSLK